METQAVEQRRESFGEFTRRLQDLFTEMEIAETPEDRELYAVTIQQMLSVEMRERVDAIAAVITRGEAWAAEASRLAQIAARHQANADRLKGYAKRVMIEMGVKELKTPTSRLLVAGNGGVQPMDVKPEDVPEHFKYVTLRVPIKQHETLVDELHSSPCPEWLIPHGVDVDNQKLREALKQPCGKCKGSGTQRADESLPHDTCTACAGSGKQYIPGAKLLDRGKHLRVEGSALLLEESN